MAAAPADDAEKRDLEIVSRCLREPGDAAWDAFLAQFGPLMRIWIRRSRFARAEDWEDIYQGLMEKILSNAVLPKFRPGEGNFRGFLHAVVNHYILDEFRKTRRLQQFPSESKLAGELAGLADEYPGRSYEYLRSEILACLARTGSDEQALAIYDDLLEDVPSKQIAQRMGVSESTVSRRRTALERISRAVLGAPEDPEKKFR